MAPLNFPIYVKVHWQDLFSEKNLKLFWTISDVLPWKFVYLDYWGFDLINGLDNDANRGSMDKKRTVI